VWSARRIADMNLFAKLATALAAVVVVAVVGYNLLPAGGGIGGGGPAVSPSPSLSPSPSPSPTPTQSRRPEPTFTVGAFPAAGSLSIGRYAITENGVPFSLEVSTTGWRSDGQQIPPDGGAFTKGSDTSQRVWMIFWSIDGVFADPCGNVPGPVLSPSAADLAAAVAGLPATDMITPPSDVTIGGRPAKHVAIRFRGDLGCSPSQYFMWYDDIRCGGDDPCQRWVTASGQRNDVWIVEVNGTHVWIEAETFDTATPETIQEVQQMIDSIQFE